MALLVELALLPEPVLLPEDLFLVRANVGLGGAGGAMYPNPTLLPSNEKTEMTFYPTPCISMFCREEVVLDAP